MLAIITYIVVQERLVNSKNYYQVWRSNLRGMRKEQEPERTEFDKTLSGSKGPGNTPQKTILKSYLKTKFQCFWHKHLRLCSQDCLGNLQCLA